MHKNMFWNITRFYAMKHTKKNLHVMDDFHVLKPTRNIPKGITCSQAWEGLVYALKHVGVDSHGLACSKTCHDKHICFESCLTHVKKKLHALKHMQKKRTCFQMFPFKICQKWFRYCFETFYKHIDKNL
jgi:hypothetical protein